MTSELEQAINKLKTKAPQPPSGGIVDEKKINEMVEDKIFEIINNPKTAIEIMGTILKEPKHPLYPKWDELKKNVKDGKGENLIPSQTEASIIDDLLVRNNVYLLGVAGTGKTYMAENIAKMLKRAGMVGEDDDAYYTINCSQWTSPMDILGGFGVRGYRQGQAILAWSKGGVLILDELPKIDPNTAGLLNEMLAKTAQHDAAPIRDGEGVLHKKHPNFFVIGAGNTDLKSVGAGYSGNNKQDYSLYDRFAGSIHHIKFDLKLEKSLTYKAVFAISQGIRQFLIKDTFGEDSISLRVMLNFNRIYEVDMIRKTLQEGNPIFERHKVIGGLRGKTFKDSVESFINLLPPDKKEKCEAHIIEGNAGLFEGMTISSAIKEATDGDTMTSLFASDYERLNHIDINTGEPITV